MAFGKAITNEACLPAEVAYRTGGSVQGPDAGGRGRVSGHGCAKPRWPLLLIPDPPVLTITEMVRSVKAQGEGRLHAHLLRRPATEHLLGAIREAMTAHGFLPPVHIVLQLEPTWTTDWMTPDARERLRAYGISPPVGQTPTHEQSFEAAMTTFHYMKCSFA